MNEYLAFRTAHGIDDHTYKDIYIGDYITITDGTYNANWMVAHFDYYWNKGPNPSTGVRSPRGVLLIPRVMCGTSKMNETNTYAGAYYSSLINTTVCPNIATALSTVFGSYLTNHYVLLANATDDNINSNAGAGRTGGSSNWSWETVQCELLNEVQVYGTTVLSSSLYDTGIENEKLAVFNFINHLEFSNTGFWLRDVAYRNNFTVAFGHGGAANYDPATKFGIRPSIYIS